MNRSVFFVAALFMAVNPCCCATLTRQNTDSSWRFTSNVKVNPNTAQPHSFNLLLDTGRSLSFLPCSTCNQTLCGTRERLETTAQLPCDSPQCVTIQGRTCNSGSSSCTVSSSYSNNVKISLDIVEPVICVASSCHRATIGCISSIEGSPEVGRAFAASRMDGVLGLSRSSSLARQLKSFRIDLSGEGTLHADLPEVDLRRITTWTPMLDDAQGGYVISVQSVQLESKVIATQLKLEINSGSSFTWLPSSAFHAMRSEWFRHCAADARCKGRVALGIDRQAVACYHLKDKSAMQTFPVLKIALMDKTSVVIRPDVYFYKARSLQGTTLETTPYCVGLLKDDALKDTVVVGAQLLQFPVVFDLEKGRVGFDGAMLQSSGGSVQTFTPTSGFFGGNQVTSDTADLFKGFFLSFMVGVVVCFVPCMCLRQRYAKRNSARYDKIEGSEGDVDMPEGVENGAADYAYEIGDITDEGSSDEELGTFDLIAEDEEPPNSPKETREQLLERAENLFERSSHSTVDRT